MSPTSLLLSKLEGVSQAGSEWSARCPAHDDQRASLSITEAANGNALIYCHAGCKVEAICQAVGFRLSDLMAPTAQSGSPVRTHIVATYDYEDEDGNLLIQVVRFEPKDFRQRRLLPNGKWDWRVKGIRVVPYRLPNLLAEPDELVLVVEGEKDVANLAGIGLLATCNAGGAGKWTDEHSKYLAGRHVVVLADNDEPGRQHAEKVAQSLHPIVASVRVIDLPTLPPKGDVSDWIASGGTKDQLVTLIDGTPNWSPNDDASPWPELVSFAHEELPPFPIDALPPVLRAWVIAESHATQTPPDLASLMALAVIAAVLAGRVVVVPRPGWMEPVNIYVAVLLEPGNRKSAVFADATRPLRDLENELIEAARPTVAREQSERRQAERRLQALEKSAVEKDDAEARYQAAAFAEELATRSEAILPRLIVDDATTEKIGIILGEQGGRIASMSPEGGVFDLMAGQYSKSGAPQFGVYLMGHSGDALRVDRVGRDSVRVEKPALTCAYAMQPQVIEGLARNSAFRGRGLLARFLYAAPRSWIGRREIAPPPVPDTTRDAYYEVVRYLHEMDGESELQLSENAVGALRKWETEIERMLADGGEMENMRDWGAKLAGATVRLSGLLHCIEHGRSGQIDELTIAAAIRIARYLIRHAESVLNKMSASEDSADDDARYVLRWIERHGRQEFTKREAQQHGKRRFRKADDIDPALNELVRRGFIRLRTTETSGAGRPPSPTYEVNPVLFGDENGEMRSRYSQNSECGSEGGVFENIESAFERSLNASRMRVTV